MVRKRKVIQLVSALIYNANLKGFFQGSIYQGNLKNMCVPGLNCYSCPGAVAACPLGSLQSAIGSASFKLPYYIVGLLLLFGVLFGRLICAFLCPFGLIQELLYKIPAKKLKKSRATRWLSWLKYVILAVFVIYLPLYLAAATGVGSPAFCKWICPAGTLEAGVPLVSANQDLQNMIGWLFHWKVLVLLATLTASVFIYRPFCRFLCPLGAIYSFFNRFAFFGVRVDEAKCSHCGKCVRACKMDVKKINDRECIRCGECRSVCEFDAITTTSQRFTAVIRRNRQSALEEASSCLPLDTEKKTDHRPS